MESLENTTPHITSVDIDEKVYRADGAIAASDLKYAKDHGLQAFHTYKYGKDNPPRIATPAMKLGSMIHKWILEPDSFSTNYALLEEKRTKKGKELALACEEQGLLTYNSQEKELLDNIEHALVENNFAWKYLLGNVKNKQGLAEQSFWWKHRETGLQCKCRCDYVIDDMVIDLKTCGEGGASPDKFTKTIVNFHYHMAASHYLQGTGAKRFIFIAVEKVFPFAVSVTELDADALAFGLELRNQALQGISLCHTDSYWPSYTEKITTISLPKWATY